MAKKEIDNSEDLMIPYGMIYRDDVSRVRAEIISKAAGSEAVFYNWMGNKSEIPKLAKSVLKKIFAKQQKRYLKALSRK